MDWEKLNRVLQTEPKYRTEQVRRAVFVDLVTDWNEAVFLPGALREKLNRECPLGLDVKEYRSKDGQTVKAVFNLMRGSCQVPACNVLQIIADRFSPNPPVGGPHIAGPLLGSPSTLTTPISYDPGLKSASWRTDLGSNIRIESVLMGYKDGRQTVCVSSQVGCQMGCAFCATGKMGFARNLTVGEIIDQVLYFARRLKKEGKKVSNIVFMGMGEPFLNYDNVISAIRLLNAKDGFGLGARRFSISTCGIPEGIGRLAKEGMEVNLAISLHAPDNELRSKLMPVNKKYPLGVVFPAVDEYIRQARRKVMFEYLMIKGVNDSMEQAEKLAKLIFLDPRSKSASWRTDPGSREVHDPGSYIKKLSMVNLITYNPTGNFEPSSQETISRFKDYLMKKGVNVTQRFSFGQDIKAACGQLAVLNNN